MLGRSQFVKKIGMPVLRAHPEVARMPTLTRNKNLPGLAAMRGETVRRPTPPCEPG